MGRHKLFHTEEERHEADKAYKRKYYEKNKVTRRDHYRLTSLRSYYNRKLRDTTDETARNKIITKINTLTDQLNNLPAIVTTKDNTNDNTKDISNVTNNENH